MSSSHLLVRFCKGVKKTNFVVSFFLKKKEKIIKKKVVICIVIFFKKFSPYPPPKPSLVSFSCFHSVLSVDCHCFTLSVDLVITAMQHFSMTHLLVDRTLIGSLT